MTHTCPFCGETDFEGGSSEMKIKDYPMVTMLFMLMGLDTGAHVNEEAEVPEEWRGWFKTAEEEAATLDSQEAETLTQGAEEDQLAVKEKAPYAAKLLDCAFDDGPIANLVFRPWTAAVESKTAEQTLQRQILKLEVDGA